MNPRFYKLNLASVFLLIGGVVFGQNFTDNAGNYSSWTTGSNQGTGFGAWAFTTGANSGSFLGNPSNNGMGTSGIGTNAFALYATGSVLSNKIKCVMGFTRLVSPYFNMSENVPINVKFTKFLTTKWSRQLLLLIFH